MIGNDSHAAFDDLILQAAFGSLDEAEAARLSAHDSAGCEECRAMRALIDRFLRATIPPLAPSRAKAETVRERVRTSNPAPDHAPWNDYLALANAGSLAGQEFEDLRDHLDRGCSRCEDSLAELRDAGDAIASAIPPVGPSQATTTAMKSRIRRSVGAPDSRISQASVRRTGNDTAVDSPLVGRSDELAEAHRLVDRLRTGEGAFLSVTGDPGVGKSRLVRELAAHASSSGVDVLVGRCTSGARTRGYSAFIEILAELAEIPDNSDEHVRHDCLAALVDRLAGSRKDDVFPAIARLMGIDGGPRSAELLRGLSGRALENRIHESTRHLLKGKLGAAPLIIVLEDLHWADNATAELVKAVMPLVEMHALLFVTVSRAVPDSPIEQITTFADANLRLRHHRMELSPLSERESLVLTRGLLGIEELPNALSRVVTEKTGGNPFYIEELSRSYAQANDGTPDSIAMLTQHCGIDALVMSRVDQLGAKERKLLETTAVVGQRAQMSLLEALEEGSGDFTASLAHLERMHLLERIDSRETSNRRVARLRTEPVLTFRHALVRNAVLASISDENRRALHERCAATIERLFSDRLAEYYGVLAYQYSQARRPEQAQHYLILAGESAATSAASADALQFFREAHATYRDLEGLRPDKNTEARLERNLALALLNTGNLAESIPHFNTALRLMGQWVPESRVALALRGALDLGRILGRLYTGTLGRAHTTATEKDQLVFELLYNRCRAQNIVDDKRREIDNLTAIAHVGHLNPREIENSTGILAAAGAFFGFSGISFDPSRRLLSLARNAAVPGSVSDEFLYRTMSFVVNHLEGNWEDSHHIDEQLLNHGLRYGLFWDADVYLGFSCEQFSYQGRFERAVEQLEHLETLCDSWGYGFARSNLYAESALLRLSQRRLDDALAAEQRWYDLRNEPSLHYMALGLRARTQVAAGRHDEAERSLDAADTLLARSGVRMFPYYSGLYHTARLALATVKVEELATRSGPIDGALARSARSVSRKAIRNARSCARDRCDSLRLSARLEWALGRKEQAVALWTDARAECERLGALPDLGRTLADMSIALEEVDDEWRERIGLSSVECRAEAKRIFEELGCGWDLDQLEESPQRRSRAA